MLVRLTLSVKSYKSPQIRLGDPHAGAETVGNKLAGGDPAPDGAGTNAKLFRRLGDGEELDSVAPIMVTVAF